MSARSSKAGAGRSYRAGARICCLEVEMEKTSRALSEARYILDTGCTLRQCAAVFGVGKSTVHADVTARLAAIDSALGEEVARVLERNLEIRHIRGGESTRKKYRALRSKRG